MIKKINEMGNPITLVAYRQKVASLTSSEIISSYLTCADCGSEFLSYHDAIEVANHSKTRRMVLTNGAFEIVAFGNGDHQE